MTIRRTKKRYNHTLTTIERISNVKKRSENDHAWHIRGRPILEQY